MLSFCHQVTLPNGANAALRVISVPPTVAAVQAEIQQNGPVSAAIYPVCDAFMSYVNQLSQSSTPFAFSGDCSGDPQAGGHAIQIVGWQTVSGVPAWKVRNSWGASTGYNGYFFVPLSGGPSSLNILSNVYTVLAGSQTAAGPQASQQPGTSAAPPVGTTAAEGTTAPAVQPTSYDGASWHHPQHTTLPPLSSDDDDSEGATDTAAPGSGIAIVDYADAVFKAHSGEYGFQRNWVGVNLRLHHPHRHPHVQKSIDAYLHKITAPHNVTKILWASRQVRRAVPSFVALVHV